MATDLICLFWRSNATSHEKSQKGPNHSCSRMANMEPFGKSPANLVGARWNFSTHNAKIAHAAKLSGCTSQDVQDFASIGAFGKHHQNCHRDLIRKMPQSLVPESFPVTCNVKDSKATSVDVRQVPLKLPCLWMHHLSTELEGTVLFHGFFGTLKLADFWSKVDLKKGQDGKITNSRRNQIGSTNAFLLWSMAMGQSFKTMTVCFPYPSKGCWTQLMISKRICGLQAFQKGLLLLELQVWKALTKPYGSGYHGLWQPCSTTNGLLQTVGVMIFWILRHFSARLDATFFLMDFSVCWLAS